MDRQDIDALLVSALYGELTPAEEARLTVHLESHPADRGALDDLKSARAKVRESRIFALQAEPPQHISALLLQEAHRRAPKKVVADDGERRDSWFWRFARSFALHPAMAAAAMLVVVLGVSALVYKNKGADFANREVQAPTAKSESRASGGDTMTATPTIVDQPQQGMAAGSAAPSEAFHAGLAEDRDLTNDPSAGAEGAADKNAESAAQRWRNDNAADGKVAAPSPAKNKGIVVSTEQAQPKDLDGDTGRDEAELSLQKEQKAEQQKKTARKADSNEDSLSFSGRADDSYGTATGSTAPSRGAGAGGGAANGMVVGGAPGAAAPATTAPTAPKGNVAGPVAAPTTPSPNRAYAQPPPPPPAADKGYAEKSDTPKPPAVKQEAKPDAKIATKPTAPSTGTGTASGAKTGGATANTKTSTATNDTKKVTTQAPAKKPAPAPVEEKTVAKAPPKDSATKSPAPQQTPPPADPTVAWAKNQHARAVTLAKAGDCTSAAQVALAVSQKAPAYYASFMASDRELKSCKSYIDNARDREAEKSAKSRAQKRVNADEAAPANENAK